MINTQATPSLGVAIQSASLNFLQNSVLKATIGLYRGYLHEINNALAGIGTLAEALKGSEDHASVDSHLDLIVHTTQKSAQLQRRIRALVVMEEELEVSSVDASAFLQENLDLIELMLPRNCRLQLQIVPQVKGRSVCKKDFWQALLVMTEWLHQGQAASATTLVMDVQGNQIALQARCSHLQNSTAVAGFQQINSESLQSAKFSVTDTSFGFTLECE